MVGVAGRRYIMPWKTVLQDPEYKQVLVAVAVTLIKYAPAILAHLRIWRVEKKLDGVMKDRKPVTVPRPRKR